MRPEFPDKTLSDGAFPACTAKQKRVDWHLRGGGDEEKALGRVTRVTDG